VNKVHKCQGEVEVVAEEREAVDLEGAVVVGPIRQEANRLSADFTFKIAAVSEIIAGFITLQVVVSISKQIATQIR